MLLRNATRPLIPELRVQGFRLDARTIQQMECPMNVCTGGSSPAGKRIQLPETFQPSCSVLPFCKREDGPYWTTPKAKFKRHSPEQGWISAAPLNCSCKALILDVIEVAGQCQDMDSSANAPSSRSMRPPCRGRSCSLIVCRTTYCNM